MTSELRVTTLSNATGDGPATLTKQNAAKCWVCQNGEGTPSAFGSFNLASLTDNGTGNYNHNWTNNFSDKNYSYVGCGHASSVAWLFSIYTGDPTDTTGNYRSTSTTNIQHAGSSTSLVDARPSQYIGCGDLA